MTIIALLRHAETEWSSEGRIQGRTDIPLSDAGRRALKQRAIPADCREMRVLTSPLRRCVETASLLGMGQAQCEERLAEMHWGEWEGRRLGALRAELGQAMSDNESRGLDFTPRGGESPRQVFDRVRPLLAAVASEGRATLAISHKGVMRAIFAIAMGWDMTGRPPLKLDWTAVHFFRVDSDGIPSAVRLNLPMDRRPVSPEPA